jgi:hypothetical protein
MGLRNNMLRKYVTSGWAAFIDFGPLGSWVKLGLVWDIFGVEWEYQCCFGPMNKFVVLFVAVKQNWAQSIGEWPFVKWIRLIF